jgi:hypothetical protein
VQSKTIFIIQPEKRTKIRLVKLKACIGLPIIVYNSTGTYSSRRAVGHVISRVASSLFGLSGSNNRE